MFERHRGHIAALAGSWLLLQACTGSIGEGPLPTAPPAQPADCHLDPGETLVRRLTRYEFSNTIKDVLDVEVGSAVDLLPADPRAEGFSNTADALVVSYQHVEAYDSLSETIAAGVDWSTFVDKHTSCTDFSAGCQNDFIESLGLEMFRRPLKAAERDLFSPLFTVVNEEGDDFATAAQLVVRAMLQSPQFLYRVEDQVTAPAYDVVRELNSYEVATRMSYLLWGSSPDSALMTAAAANELQTDEQLRAQVERMLDKPRARETARRYMREWLALDSLDTLSRDPIQYPEWDADLASEVKEETLALFDQLVWEEPTAFRNILTSQFTFASERVANLYGLENVTSGVNEYDLSDVPERVGLLSHASFQAVNGIGNRPSMVARGIFMLYGMLCRSVDAPPAQVDTSMPQALEDQSQRYYSGLRLENKVCVTCHSQFDPLAYAFERYDGIGRYRLQDDDGNALEQDGWFVSSLNDEPVPYDNIEEYAQILADSEAVQRCFVEKPLQFAIGRPVEKSDTCTMDRVVEATAEGGGQYQSMVMAIALDPTFRQIAAE